MTEATPETTTPVPLDAETEEFAAQIADQVTLARAISGRREI